jgi:hypothetical protein
MRRVPAEGVQRAPFFERFAKLTVHHLAGGENTWTTGFIAAVQRTQIGAAMMKQQTIVSSI